MRNVLLELHCALITLTSSLTIDKLEWIFNHRHCFVNKLKGRLEHPKRILKCNKKALNVVKTKKKPFNVNRAPMTFSLVKKG